MGANIFTYTDAIDKFVTKQLDPDHDSGRWVGFVKDSATGRWLAKYGDGRELSHTNLIWDVGCPISDLNECTSVIGKIIVYNSKLHINSFLLKLLSITLI